MLVVGRAGAGDRRPSRLILGVVGVERDRTERVPEQTAAQLRDLVIEAPGLVGRRGPDVVGEPRRLGPIGPLDLPGDPRRLLDQELLELIAGPELIVVQASIRPRYASASSPGKTGVFASMPCFVALNFERSFPSGVLGPVLFRALRRLISARSAAVVVAVMVVSAPKTGASS